MGRRPKFKVQPKRNGLVEEKPYNMSYSKVGIILNENQGEKDEE